jgi:hypothetical protein
MSIFLPFTKMCPWLTICLAIRIEWRNRAVYGVVEPPFKKQNQRVAGSPFLLLAIS